MEKKKTIILSSIILGVLVLTLGITYAIFSYQETSNNTSQLIMGDIYMHYKENNQLILNNAMPQEGFKTLITGYNVNPIMAEQDASDTTTELYACINLFQNEWGWRLDEGEDFESFCKGTGTQYGWTLQMYLDNDFGEDDYNELSSLNIIQEETIEYTSIKMNPEIATQTAEYENELTACVALFDLQGISEVLDEGSTTETFCQGTGTFDGGVTLQQFWDLVNQEDGFMEEIGNTLVDNNIMVLENDLYVVNPNMANQTVGEINELMTCVGLVTKLKYEFDEGTTAESFCKGEGTYDGGITLKGEFEGLKDNIDYMTFVGNKLLDNNIILASVDLPYFEFTISGKNTYSEKDIYYDIKLDYGDPHETRNTRLEDNFLKFRLIEVNPDKTEKIIFDNKSYSSIENQKIHTEIISKNTMSEINKTYRLYMWINEDVVIGNIDEDYTIDEWNDVFASVKVNVSGEIDKLVPLSTKFKSVLETKTDTTVTDETGTIYISGTNDSGLQNVFRYGTNEIEVPDTHVVDYNYVWYSGKLWRIICLYPDGTMKLATDNPVTSIEFGENNNYETSHVNEWLNQEFLPTLYNYNSIIKMDSLWNLTEKTNFDGEKMPETNMYEAPIGLLNIYEVYKIQEVLITSPINELRWYPNELSYINGARINSWTLTPYVSEWYIENDIIWDMCFWDDTDGPETTSTVRTSGVRPVIILQSTVRFSGGTGTRNDPYTIEGDMEKASVNTLINQRQSGEYVKLENDETNQLFRIVDIEKINNKLTTKLMLDDYVQDVDKLNQSNFNESENLYLRFSLYEDREKNMTWSDLDKTNTTLWRGYLNNVWIKKIDNTYNEETGESQILERGKYYLGVYDPVNYYTDEPQYYKSTVCGEILKNQSIKECISNGNVVSNIVEDDYIGLPRIGEMFARSAAKDYVLTPEEKRLLTLQFLITPTGNPANFNIFADYSYLDTAYVNYVHWARPTINLKSNLVIKSGLGTFSDPFVVGLPD